ncbi:hypothetical protein J5W80_05950 [Akkermansia muciniphila]|uniref:hypothetical protein n=1 Tax=Akkermansia muciniphila TaxID=239935 RepID=UPI001C063833|nr:hypothetical protein [Akkermansia muciniphila]QWP30374.1 hypothetical protein J5W80_05950 [Akkermansia muciniphila]
MLFAVVIFLSVVVLGVIAALRFTKGIIPLRTYESRELPGFPGPAGLIHRLDGAEKTPAETGESPVSRSG